MTREFTKSFSRDFFFFAAAPFYTPNPQKKEKTTYPTNQAQQKIN
jgi:hypothetical protein